MACNVLLSDRIPGADPGGYYVYLGYSITSKIAASTNVIGDTGDLCFGIANPLVANIVYVDTPASNISPMPYMNFGPYLGTTVGFDGVTPGFYGFMYIVGDTETVNGIIDGVECGEVECFEIEVVDSPAEMIPANYADVCESNLPITLDLTTELIGTGTVVGGVENYIAGGTWTVSGNTVTIDISNPALVVIPATQLGTNTLVFQYVLNAVDLSSTHPVDGSCADCSATILVELTVTEQLAAGVGTSLAVCN